MNPVVKLTKQGVRDLDSGRKKTRVAPAEEAAPAEEPGGSIAEATPPLIEAAPAAEADRVGASSP